VPNRYSKYRSLTQTVHSGNIYHTISPVTLVLPEASLCKYKNEGIRKTNKDMKIKIYGARHQYSNKEVYNSAEKEAKSTCQLTLSFFPPKKFKKSSHLFFFFLPFFSFLMELSSTAKYTYSFICHS